MDGNNDDMVTKPKTKFAEWATNVSGPMVLDEDGLPFDGHKPYFYSMYKGLQRYIEAQDKDDRYLKALKTVTDGEGIGKWVYFIFPQRVEDESEMSKFYRIASRDEAQEYIEHPILRERLVEISEAVLNNEKSVYEIFGNDAIKVRSCILLFESVSDIPVFKQLKSKYRW